MKIRSAHRDIVLIGGSGGSIEPFKKVVSAFPPDLLASIFVVIHTGQGSAYLPNIFNRNGRLPAFTALDKIPVFPRRIYIAPPGRHLVLAGNHVRLVLGPRENLHRPAIDVLFRSGANSYRDRVIAVLLSGYGDDGSIGLAIVKNCGGVAIVQDPKDALVSQMPVSALKAVEPDFILAADRIGEQIVKLVQKEPSQKKSARSRRSSV